LLFPAYIVGLGVGPFILMILFRILNIDLFQHLFIFFIVGSALASIGSSLLSAWMAPSAKPLVGILGATATGVLGPIMFFVGHSVGGTPLFAIFSGYIGGAILAIVLLLLLKRNTQPAA